MPIKTTILLILSLFFTLTSVSEAGAIGNFLKKSWSATKHIAKGSERIARTISTVVIAGVTLKELNQYPMEPVIQKAREEGITTYQTRVCDSPDGVVTVPEWFSVCPDGSSVSNGSVINLE